MADSSRAGAACGAEAGQTPRFPLPPSALKELLQQGFTHDSTKINADALSASMKLCEAFVSEALTRAQNESESVGASEVAAEHLEKVLPTLLLDFGP